MNEKNDNNNLLPNNIIVSIAHLLLPEIQEYYDNNKNEKDNIIQGNSEEKNEVKPSA